MGTHEGIVGLLQSRSWRKTPGCRAARRTGVPSGLQMGAMEAAGARWSNLVCHLHLQLAGLEGDSTSIQAVLAGVPSRSAK
jgi:hypothetical protein